MYNLSNLFLAVLRDPLSSILIKSEIIREIFDFLSLVSATGLLYALSWCSNRPRSSLSWPSSIQVKHQKILVSELKRLVKLLKLGTSIYNIEVRVGVDMSYKKKAIANPDVTLLACLEASSLECLFSDNIFLSKPL